MTGTIKSLVRKTEKTRGGFGFIVDEFGDERFFHAKNLRSAGTFESLREGLRVQFDPFTDDRGRGNGLRADNVQVIA